MSSFFQRHLQELMQAYPEMASLYSHLKRFADDYEKATQAQNKSLEIGWLYFQTFLLLVKEQIAHPYQFAPFHQAVRTPFDYFQFGLDFVGNLLNKEKSAVFGKEHLQKINQSIEQNENVILLSNHQTEIDPQIISLLIQNEYPKLSEEMIMMAGHRVTQDPLAIPFSLGLNLFCIYSKRHIDNPPEKKLEKLQHNQRTLKAMEEELRKGGKCIYVAPSGGRDRKNEHGEFEVTQFDPKSIEMLKLVSQKAKTTTHFHTLSLLTYELLPPPDQIATELGEERYAHYSPAFLFFGERIDMDALIDTSISDKQLQRQHRSDLIWQQTAKYYSFLVDYYKSGK